MAYTVREVTPFSKSHDSLRDEVAEKAPELLERFDGLYSYYAEERRKRIRAEAELWAANDDMKFYRNLLRKLEKKRKNVVEPYLDRDEGTYECTCGMELDGDQAFCQSCGAWIDYDAAAPPEPDDSAYDAWRDMQLEEAWEARDGGGAS